MFFTDIGGKLETIFETRNLSKQYDLGRKGFLRFEKNYMVAVNRVNLSVKRGETHGIVGESGSGKTTLARLMMKLSEPSSGSLIYDKKDITAIKGKALKEIRKKIQIIFQDPYSSLDPRKNISTLISEPMVIQQVPKSLFKDKMTQALEFVNLPLSDSFQNKYPDELSGGQRQRVGIARALIIDPEFIIADESVSMLDASIKAGIINLLLELKERKNLTYLFITHELALAYHICDRISVMHRGRIVESGACSDVIKSPIHPYTRELILSNPPLFPDSGWIKRPQSNTAFSPDNESGCGFLMRCPKRKKICGEQFPELKDFGGGHLSTCNID